MCSRSRGYILSSSIAAGVLWGNYGSFEYGCRADPLNDHVSCLRYLSAYPASPPPAPTDDGPPAPPNKTKVAAKTAVLHTKMVVVDIVAPLVL